MSATQTQLRRGTATQNDALTGAVGEVTVDTTNDRLRVHDAAKAGGFHVPNHEDVQGNRMAYAAATGAASGVIVATYAPVPPAPFAGMKLDFKADAANPGACTFNPNAAGADDIVKDDGAGALIPLEGGEFAPGGIYTVKYNGSEWHLQAAGTASGGGWEEIAVTNFGASPYIEFTGLDTDFSAFELQIDEIGNSLAQYGVFVWLGVDGGAVNTSNNQYESFYQLVNYSNLPGSGVSYAIGDGTGIQLDGTEGSGLYYDGGNYRGYSGKVRINSPAMASFRPVAQFEGQTGGSAQPYFKAGQGHTKFNAANVTAIRVGTKVQNLTHGRVTLRGFREA